MTSYSPGPAVSPPSAQIVAGKLRSNATRLGATLTGVVAAPQAALAAGATVPDFGPGGAIVMLALHGAFYLLVFAVLPAVVIYAGYRLVTGTRMRLPVTAALQSRYVYSVAAVVAWVVFVAFGTDGFASRHMSGLREWAIFAGIGGLVFVLPLYLMALFRRDRTGVGAFARIAAVAVVGVLASSVIYTAIEPQSAERARALLEAAATSIYEHEAAYGETPRRLDELPGNLRRVYLCRKIEFEPAERRLALDIYVTDQPSIMYRLSFGCLGRFSRGETITRTSLQLKPKVTSGLVDQQE